MKALHSDQGKLCEVLSNVFIRNRRRWLGYLACFLDNRGDADDVLQEAVGRVLARNLPFTSEDQLRMYLGRAISNTAIEFYHLRRKERMCQRPLDLSACADQGRGSPEDLLERMEEYVRTERARHLMRAGLSKLPPKQYEALCLTYLNPECSSIREAGLSRGIPYSTLRHRSIQGIRRLRRYVCRRLDAGHSHNSPGSASGTT